MARLQVDEDERIATATQHATELASTNQDNATMESQMQTLIDKVQALQLANTPNHGADVHRRLTRSSQITAEPTVTADTAAENAHTLLMDTRRRRPSHI